MTNEEKKKAGVEAKERICKRVGDKLKEIHDEITDGFLSLVPVEITEHIGNAKKELLLAVRSLIDQSIKKIDECIVRAKEVHKKK